ncbi:MAG: hypothetical protein LBC07_04900 [Elusimicrobiota bacterium]|jgi:hypothetical protein|nr:hypothetical protein [Elusimicrobiota bacterium]
MNRLLKLALPISFFILFSVLSSYGQAPYPIDNLTLAQAELGGVKLADTNERVANLRKWTNISISENGAYIHYFYSKVWIESDYILRPINYNEGDVYYTFKPVNYNELHTLMVTVDSDIDRVISIVARYRIRLNTFLEVLVINYNLEPIQYNDTWIFNNLQNKISRGNNNYILSGMSAGVLMRIDDMSDVSLYGLLEMENDLCVTIENIERQEKYRRQVNDTRMKLRDEIKNLPAQKIKL